MPCPGPGRPTSAALAPADRRDPPARLGVLGGVVQQVAEDLLQPRRVGLQPDRRRRAGATVSVVAAVVDRRPEPPRPRGRRPRPGPRLLAELDLAPADPGDVQQVVDQPGQVPTCRSAIAALGSASCRRRPAAASGAGRCGSGPAGCAARGRASPGTRPCGGRPRPAPPSARAARPPARLRSVTSVATPIIAQGARRRRLKTRPLLSSQWAEPSGRAVAELDGEVDPAVRGCRSRPPRRGRGRRGGSGAWNPSNVPSNPPGGRPWIASRFSDQATSPVLRFQSQVPMCPAARARRSRSSFSRRHPRPASGRGCRWRCRTAG